MERREMAYWGVTALFSLIFLGGGASHVVGTEDMTAGMTKLGYPLYVMKIIGTAKILGAITLLIPAQPFLKEWAYAGFAIDLIGAVASHAFVGDPMGEIMPPLVLLALGAVSYALRPASRRLVPAPLDG